MALSHGREGERLFEASDDVRIGLALHFYQTPNWGLHTKYRALCDRCAPVLWHETVASMLFGGTTLRLHACGMLHMLEPPALAMCRYCEEEGLPPLPAIDGRNAKLAAIDGMRQWEPAAGSPLDQEEELLRLGPSKSVRLYRHADISGLKLRCTGGSQEWAECCY